MHLLNSPEYRRVEISQSSHREQLSQDQPTHDHVVTRNMSEILIVSFHWASVMSFQLRWITFIQNFPWIINLFVIFLNKTFCRCALLERSFMLHRISFSCSSLPIIIYEIMWQLHISSYNCSQNLMNNGNKSSRDRNDLKPSSAAWCMINVCLCHRQDQLIFLS